MEQGHLLFVQRPTGYELVQREGAPPSIGEVLEYGERREQVTKLAASPLPQDPRVCAYLQPL